MMARCMVSDLTAINRAHSARYACFNPVKHGYVQRVIDWPYSSFHMHVKKGLCPIDWAGGGGDGEVYGERGSMQ